LLEGKLRFFGSSRRYNFGDTNALGILLATRSVSLGNRRTLYSAEQSFRNMPRCYARLRVLGVGAVVLLLVLTAATFGADYYLVSASASLPYREITLDHL